jgi:hypothetical protein
LSSLNCPSFAKAASVGADSKWTGSFSRGIHKTSSFNAGWSSGFERFTYWCNRPQSVCCRLNRGINNTVSMTWIQKLLGFNINGSHFGLIDGYANFLDWDIHCVKFSTVLTFYPWLGVWWKGLRLGLRGTSRLT